jgi:hypothetical protein
MRPKENSMIELTGKQLEALDAPEQPPVAIDPRTGQQYLLIRREVYDKVRLMLKPFARGWDDPADDDLIRKDV